MTEAVSPHSPQVQIDAIAEFIKLAFDGLSGDVNVRIIAEKGSQSAHKPIGKNYSLPVAPEAFADLARRASETSSGVFILPVTVGPGGKACAEDLLQTRLVVLDLDSGDIAAKRAHLEKHLPAASLIVASGGLTPDGQQKLHFYWRIAEPIKGPQLSMVASCRKELAAKIGGDASFARLTQPIRLPGSLHRKKGGNAEVKPVARNSQLHDLSRLASAIQDMPPFPGAPDAISGSGVREQKQNSITAASLRGKVVHEGGVDGVTRFEAISKVLGSFVKLVNAGRLDAETAWNEVTLYNLTRVAPPWPEEKLRREFNALLARDMRKRLKSAPKTEQGLNAALVEASEDAIAEAFIQRHGMNWRHVPATGRWYRWNGKVWATDEVNSIREAIRLVCRAYANEAFKENVGRRIASQATISAVQKIIAADPRIALTSSAFDVRPDLLNTLAGIVEVADGVIVPHHPDYLLSQMCEAAPNGDCPNWLSFLRTVTGGDQEMIDFLQRLCGYILTGYTNEQVVVVLHGPGANGKSVFLSTISTILGSYAATATLETFVSSRTDRHLTEIAGLHAARLVTVAETESGRSWNDARLKTLTGSDKVRVNFMRQDHFEFVPKFKVVIAGNHLPEISLVTEAMRRRLRIVPFSRIIPLHERDPYLQSKLWAERDGILNWMLLGCQIWNACGLGTCDSVEKASREYFDAENTFGRWIDERCTLGPTAIAPANVLYQAWSDWCEGNGESAGSGKGFALLLRNHGFVPFKSRGARAWKGINLARLGPYGEKSE